VSRRTGCRCPHLRWFWFGADGTGVSPVELRSPIKHHLILRKLDPEQRVSGTGNAVLSILEDIESPACEHAENTVKPLPFTLAAIQLTSIINP
jgi:hypothetical protein